MKAMLFLLLATMVIMEMTAASEDVRATGCSTFGLERTYSRVFHAACVSHDNCYARCPGRAVCDSRFLNDMRAICTRRPRDRACPGKANLFYRTVRALGGPFYLRSCGRLNR